MNRQVIFLNSKKDKWKFIIFVTLFVPAFLLIFQPFGVNNFDPHHSISFTFFFSMIGFGLVIGLTLAIFEFLVVPFLFKRLTIKNYVLSLIGELIALSSTVFLYYNVMGDFHDWHFNSFISFIFNISMLAIIPIGIIILFTMNRNTLRTIKELEMQPQISVKDVFIPLNSYNKKEKLTLLLMDFLFAEAQDNYVQIYFIENHKVKTKLLRAKLSALEHDLKEFGILRCHRSFLINGNNVERVIQTGNKMHLLLKMYSNKIPVSRSYISQISTFFATHHK